MTTGACATGAETSVLYIPGKGFQCDRKHASCAWRQRSEGAEESKKCKKKIPAVSQEEMTAC